MTTIGTATLQIIPSLAGVSDSVNKQLGGALDGKKYGKAFGKDIAAGLKSSEADVKKAFDNHAKLADKAADATGKLKVAQAGYEEVVQKGITSGKRYESAVAAQEKAQRDHTRAIKTAEDALKSYEDAAKRAAKAGDGIADSASRSFRDLASDAASRGQEAAQGFGGGFAGSAAIARLGAAGGPVGLALAGLVAVGVGVGKVLADNIAIGMQQVATIDLFQSRLGIDEASMSKVARSAADAYVNVFGQSVEDNLATAQFAFQAGLIDSKSTEADAQKVISQIDTIRNVSDADAKEIARSMSQLVNTGLAGNVGEAADAITAGFQRGFDMSGDWLDSITEYSTQFRAVGLDIADVMGLTQQALEGGAPNVDKAVDALKEFAIRAKDGSETTQNAFRALDLDVTKTSEDIAAGGPKARAAMDTVLDRIRDIPNAYDQGLVAAALFGTQWEDLQSAFNNLNLDTAKNEIGDFTGSTDRAMETASDNAATEWSEAGRRIEKTFSDLRTKMANWFDFIPKTINDLYTPGGIFSDDPPIIDNPAARNQILLPSTTGSSPSGVPELAPGLSIPGVTSSDGVPPFNFSGGSGGGNAVPSLSGLPPITTGPHVEDTGGAIVPRNAALQQSLAQMFPGAKVDNDYRKPDGFNEHSSGEAVDIAVNPGGQLGMKTPEGQAQGNAINQWLLQNAGALGLQYTIWQGKNWNPDGTSSPNSGTGITGGHWDHVHARVQPGAAGGGTPSYPSAPMSSGSGGGAFSANWDQTAQGESGGNWSTNTGNGFFGGLQFQQSTWDQYGGKEFADRADLATPEQQKIIAERTLNGWNNIPGQGPGAWPNTFVAGNGTTMPLSTGPGGTSGLGPGPISPKVINAFGPGYEPGIGTPGYNEFGEPGYYETDPRRIAQSNRSVEDNQRRIKESTQNIADIDAQIVDAQKERDRIAGMSEIERIIQKADLGKADADLKRLRDQADRARLEAKRAQEDAQWVAQDLQEAQQGSFRPAKPESGRGGGSSSLSLPSSFSGFGSAIGEFAGGQIGSALDVFGVPDSPGWLKGISTLIGGISIGDGGSANPLAASPAGTGTPPPDDPGNMHGTRAGQPPGPGVTYNITARDTEDAFIRAQRIEREKAAAKLSRF